MYKYYIVFVGCIASHFVYSQDQALLHASGPISPQAGIESKQSYHQPLPSINNDKEKINNPKKRQALVNRLEYQAGHYFSLNREEFKRNVSDVACYGDPLSDYEKKKIYEKADEYRIFPVWVWEYEERCTWSFMIASCFLALYVGSRPYLSDTQKNIYCCLITFSALSLFFLYLENPSRIQFINTYLHVGNSHSRNCHPPLFVQILKKLTNSK